MHFRKLIACATVFAAAALLRLPAAAQFAQLPKGDFTWHWGSQPGQGGPSSDSAHVEKFPDFMVRGTQSGFQCELDGKLSPGASVGASPLDVRQLEANLTTSLYFIEAAAATMNNLQFQHDLDWARLDCKKPKKTQAQTAEDQKKQQEALKKLHDKEVQKLIRRREKRERREAEDAQQSD